MKLVRMLNTDSEKGSNLQGRQVSLHLLSISMNKQVVYDIEFKRDVGENKIVI